MSKYTLVVEYEDGNEPAVHSSMDILGGRLTATSFTDALSHQEELETTIGNLTSENTYLLPQAATELAHSWLLHKTMMCAQAALLCIRQGDIHEAKRWLSVTDDAQVELPDNITPAGLQKWFDSNMVSADGKGGYLTHMMAMEVIKKTCPATANQLTELQAQGVDLFAADGRQNAEAWKGKDCCPDNYRFYTLMAESAEEFAAELRKEAVEHCPERIDG